MFCWTCTSILSKTFENEWLPKSMHVRRENFPLAYKVKIINATFTKLHLKSRLGSTFLLKIQF